jgi:hypothetical protein
VLPTSQHLKPGYFPALDFKEQLFLLKQELKQDIVNCLDAKITGNISLLANKLSPTIVIGHEVLDNSVWRALDNNREIRSIKTDISR